MATALRTTATVTTTKEIKLSPMVRRKLLAKLESYAALKQQEDQLKTARKKLGGEIGIIRAQTGEQSLDFEGFKITEVRGYTSKLDKAKLVELGCAMAWIEEATTTKPKKVYEKITCPGDDDNEGEE